MRRVWIIAAVVLTMVCLAACGEKPAEKLSNTEEEKTMRIVVKAGDYEVIYELNQSKAARELYGQLPLTLEVEDFSTNEKVFYPPEALNVSDAPLAEGGRGTLTYYSPWADVVMFYDHFDRGNSLYALRKAVSGKENIKKLSGRITVTANQEQEGDNE